MVKPIKDEIEDQLFVDWGKSFSRIFLTVSVVLFVIHYFPEQTLAMLSSGTRDTLYSKGILSRINQLAIATLGFAVVLRILVSLKIKQINDEKIEISKEVP